MKILIIEKSHSIVSKVRHLSRNYIIDVARDGKEGLAKARAIEYKTIIFGPQLADMSGRQFCGALRKRSITTPILVLTTDETIDECVDLLDQGADDFVLFHSVQPREFMARLHALARRSSRQYDTHVTTLKDLTIDSHRRWVERAGKPIPLRRKEFDILEYLIDNRGRVVTRSMILNHVWDDSKEHWHNTVDVHIKYLRDKIDRPFKTPIIRTAYGVGYIIDDAS